MGIKFEFLDAGNGDCIWITTDEGVNILIDGGWSYTYNKMFKKKEERLERDDIKTKVKELRKNNKKLDLVVLTHYDDDHIFGVYKLIEDEKKYKSETIIKEIWFNAFENAKFPIKDREENLSSDTQIKHQTGAKQQQKFEKFIEEIKEYIEYGTLISIDEIKIPLVRYSITLLSPYTDKNHQSTTDITLTLLSPNNVKLNECKEFDFDKNKSTGDKKKDWDDSYDKLLKRIQNKDKSKYSKIDTAKPNGTSIAFILEYKNEKKYLFLGDAHIDLIVDSLKELSYTSEKPLIVDFVKLSHHGSRENINREFLSLVKTNQFIILANGNKAHWHPHKETLVRVIDYYKECKEKIYFIFNYKIQDIFKDNYPLFKDEELEKNSISNDSFELIYRTKL